MHASTPSPTSKRFCVWCQRHAAFATRLTLAIVFLWFGALKLAGVSPAEELVARTFFFLPRAFVIPFLGVTEVAIGWLLLFPRTLKIGLWLIALHLPGTFLSFLVVPEMCFVRAPFVLTTNGEFIVKNLVILSAVLFVAGTLTRNKPD